MGEEQHWQHLLRSSCCRSPPLSGLFEAKSPTKIVSSTIKLSLTIPLVARIFSIADVYDVLVSDHPYRPGMPVAEAVRIIREGNGRQFDPDVVAAFERLIDAGALPPPNLDNTARSDGPYAVTSTKPLLASVGSALVHMTVSALAESRRA